ncbi:MAG: hypothetical protein AAGF46_09940, partial [Pseudomonadota bacterium]
MSVENQITVAPCPCVPIIRLVIGTAKRTQIGSHETMLKMLIFAGAGENKDESNDEIFSGW